MRNLYEALRRKPYFVFVVAAAIVAAVGAIDLALRASLDRGLPPEVFYGLAAVTAAILGQRLGRR